MTRLITAVGIAGSLTLTAATSAPTTTDVNAKWQSIGPTSVNAIDSYHVGGRISGFALPPGGDVVVAAANGGIWRRHNSMWANSSGGLTTLAFGAIAYAPSAPNVLYAGSGEMHHTIDNRDGVGVFASTNGGATWSLMANSPAEDTSALVVDPSDSTRFWVAGSAGAYLYTTAEGFVQRWSEPVDALFVDASNANVVYLADENGIEKSTNGGTTFTQLDKTAIVKRDQDDHSGEQFVISLAIAPSDHNIVYASFADASDDCLAGMVKSTDAGAHWTRLSSTPDYFNFRYAYGFSYDYCQGSFDNALAVSPSDPNVVIAGGVGLVRSADGGTTWTLIDQDSQQNRTIHTDHHALAFDASGNVLDANDGGIWRVPVNGTPSDLNDGLSIAEFVRGGSALGGAQTVMGGTQDNGVLQIAGAGSGPNYAYTQILGGDGGHVAFDPTMADQYYAEQQFGDLWVQKHGGDITELGPNVPGAPMNMSFIVSPADFMVVFAGGTQLYRSDRGAAKGSWVAMSARNTKSSISAFAFSDSQYKTALLGWSDGGFAVASGGMSAQKSVPWTTKVDDIVAQGSGALVVSGGKIYRTMDVTSSSLAWDDITGDLGCAANVLMSFKSGYVVGTECGVFWRASENAPSWIRMGTELPLVPVTDLVANGNTLLALTWGRGIWVLYGN